MQSPELLDQLKAKFPDAIVCAESQAGRQAVVVKAAGLLGILKFLRDEPGMQFDLLADLAGADYSLFPEHAGGALCVSYQLLSTRLMQRGWLKVYVPMDAPKVPSAIPVYEGANWYERECWDMYGVEFVGHPHLKRLLLYEEFQGHPLRKEYPILKMQPLIPMRNAVDYEAVRVAARKAEP